MTETLDKLYLELSQITKARNEREVFVDAALRQVWQCLEAPTERNLKHARIVIDGAIKKIERNAGVY